ncbi:hypothetical protein B0A49_08959 [Cryomyces minteri]|uniref:G-protein coupled receptors family 1 profile domain-containing protein n=1 Tax=Cryomyces minteri TaxID=331657 RepID=A0A4U0WV02_9PEZI|nr:hypothetical protein B0A49_08959 [Cryomyces minteri]
MLPPSMLTAIPVLQDLRSRNEADHGQTVVFGESPTDRTIYSVVTPLCMFLLAFMLGSRARNLHTSDLRALEPLRILVISLYLFAAIFVLSSGVLETGLGLTTQSECRASILTCVIFYIGSKILLYVFLVERIYAIRSSYATRFKDWLWVICMSVLVIGVGAIAVIAFLWPLAHFSAVDGKCRIGFPKKVSIPLLIYDTGINVVLSVILIHLLRPLLHWGPPAPTSRTLAYVIDWFHLLFGIPAPQPIASTSSGASTIVTPELKKLKKLVAKSTVGTIMVLIPTVANLVILLHFDGSEQGWMCFTICTLDGK